MLVRECMKRNVFSISREQPSVKLLLRSLTHHIGLLPVINEAGKLIGVVGLRDLLTLEMPDFFELLPELDFVHDFGAVETTRPTAEQLDRPVTTLMQPATIGSRKQRPVAGICPDAETQPARSAGRLGGWALVGIASRVDIGTAILATWKTIRKRITMIAGILHHLIFLTSLWLIFSEKAQPHDHQHGRARL